ncbi:iron chelate uptake ABC transporter family permease subunit [Microbacterium sp. H1-D42]|uniref:iron chelate uptake ABC transporter family permease subunit n=1 Tax=Microbacterium sp. H1-D42 TaxID=2925844 RepID=UPI001F53157E|nr:iron chelate uptake ABC transporter family permease subunit [Microbacterium sp. H1-D42]UNK70261.1 iron chelate uptake ABC transporter family permease subunit [Microbacterium sp. H1-D42]
MLKKMNGMPARAHSGRAGTFATPAKRRRYILVLSVLIALSVFFAVGLLAWGNPMPFGTDGFWRIAELRFTNVTVMLVVAVCQAVATVSFQTVTTNRIITPSIMGFESLYRVVQTGSVYLFGIAGLVAFQGLWQFGLQVAIMVGLAMLLYGWLLTGRYANLEVMLLIGIVIGGGLGAIATFMQRLLTPSEFDVLAAKLFGNISNADASYLPLAIPLCVGASALLWMRARRLDVMALGSDTANSLGINHRRELMIVLFLVAVLMATSTALVGPMTFLGFLVATLAYQFVDAHDHRLILPVAVLTAFTIIAGAYFLMRNVFYAEGVVSIIIELVGGIVFLIVILRKGRL